MTKTTIKKVLTTHYLFMVLLFFQKGFAMEITSSKFSHNGDIPKVYTCEGDNISPPISWSGVPNDAKSLVLIVDDPDAPDPRAPQMTWVHWVLYNIPITSNELAENIETSNLPKGIKVGFNDWKSKSYGGPCPPIGKHRYFFKLYALDIILNDLDPPTKDQLLNAMQTHIVAKAELIGKYQKK